MRSLRILAAVTLALRIVLATAGCAREPKRAWEPSGEAARARVATVRQLVLDKDPATAAGLCEALSDADPVVRRLAVYGLERIGDPENAPHILPLMDDKDTWVRRTAAVALGRLRNRIATKRLCQALRDDDVHVRYDSFIALGRIGDPSSQKAILAAMRDMRIWTELDAWDQMGVLHVVERDWFSDRDAERVLRWLLSYGHWDHPGFERLEEGRRRSFALLIPHKAAVILATRFHDASGVPWLIEGLSSDDYMQQDSARALGHLKAREAVPGLIKMLDSRWQINKRHAAGELGAIGDRSALAPLEKLLAHGDFRVRRTAAEALEKIDRKKREVAPDGPAATIPEIAEDELETPGGKRPPQFIVLGVDDCANIEGIESMLDIVETLKEHGAKVVFTMWVAPLAGDPDARDMLKQKLIYQRLFDLGSEVAHHTLHHNPGGHNWRSLPREQQVEEIEGCVRWYRDNIVGFTRPFSFKSGGGGRGGAVDEQFSRELVRKQNFIYRGRRGRHPIDIGWPDGDQLPGSIPCGCLDGSAPPVHAEVTCPISSDYPGQFDYEVADGVAMMKANFEARYNHPRRPILAVNAYHDWGFKSLDDSTSRYSHRNQARILKEFLLDVLAKNKDKYPDTYCVTFRQVLEYARTGGDLAQTLAIGNGQDSRNPVKPSIE